jgi:hypothetical protein
MHDQHGAGGVLGAGGTHRTEQQASETAVAAASENEQVRVPTLFDQGAGGPALACCMSEWNRYSLGTGLPDRVVQECQGIFLGRPVETE